MTSDRTATSRPWIAKVVTISAVGFALILGSMNLSPTAMAQDNGGHGAEKSPEEAIGEATRSLVRALELILRAIPQYAPPEVNENGDIIIRRIRPKPDKKMPPAPPENESKPQRI